MLSASSLSDIPGGNLLLEWFGRAPTFHDAKLIEINFSGKGKGLLRVHTWNLTNEVDTKGHFVLEKHAIVTFALEGVSAVHCEDFDKLPSIIFNLEITKVGEHWRIEWDASYGVTGLVTAKHLQFDLQPGKAG
jgi:hypothetical protein